MTFETVYTCDCCGTIARAEHFGTPQGWETIFLGARARGSDRPVIECQLCTKCYRWLKGEEEQILAAALRLVLEERKTQEAERDTFTDGLRKMLTDPVGFLRVEKSGSSSPEEES